MQQRHHLEGPHRPEGVGESLPFPARAHKQQQEIVVLDPQAPARRGPVAPLKTGHVHAIADEMNPIGRKGKVAQDLPLDHFRIDDHTPGIARVERFSFKPEDVAMKCAPTHQWPAPPGRVLAAALQPDSMHAVPGPIHILPARAFQTENTIEALPGQLVPHRLREGKRPPRA